MEAVVSALVVLLLILFYLGLGVWVFAGLFLVSVTGLALLLDMPLQRIGTIAASISYRYASTWELAAIPMFIWMGEIIFRTDISDRLFRGLAPFVDRIPGRLLHTNVLGCTLFAAVSGSSAATAATIGKITTSELDRRGYDRKLALGSLAGAGSLGLLIPPSIVMIVYGILAEVSISRLFAAGILPGLLIAGLYSGYIMIRAILRPELAPLSGDESSGWGDRFRALGNLLPIIILMVLVLGSIYSGIATPSEAAAVGVFAALVIALAMGQLTPKLFMETLAGAVRTSCMVCIILISAAFLATAMGYLHVPRNVASAIAAMDLSPIGLILVLSLFYILLGLFLDGISIVVMSLPITLPLAMQAGFDPIWFGIYLVIMTEMGQITPPVGFNLFVLQGLTGDPIGRVAVASLPFFFLMCIGVLILTVFPQIALVLPTLLYG
ncbi:TRAP transporter large permease [Lutibaculum baratangense]|uniref:TRAP transporter large permease protein n=1 Tax=Lutibaculum baratangense AMV1 TaxID=631454 RepID=V4TJ17_9HYPH|nr:TRAP transporter large permease subunit [Lutibaculum baratangense]ESR25918.1 TRAP dicarboxylate transporter, DctM subunit, unknown substrate 5 [Lutibaculum baratangense AMV1]